MPAAFEELLAFIAAQLSDPVDQQFEEDGTVVFVGGDPGEVIVRLTPSTVSVAEYAVSWETPYTPVVEPIEIGVVNWQAISADAAMRTVKAFIAAAREARRAKFRVCEICAQSTPPERMHDDEVCESCSQMDLGVVH